MMKHRLILIFITIGLSSCCGQDKDRNSSCNDTGSTDRVDSTIITSRLKTIDLKLQQVEYSIYNTFVPDTSVNNILFLTNSNSTIDMFGDIMSLLQRQDDDFPNVCFVNSDGKEYLRLTLHPGSSFNQISFIEIGFSDHLNNTVPKNKSTYKHFFTESGILLGMSEEKVKSIKGYDVYFRTSFDNFKVLTYIIEEPFVEQRIFISKFLEIYNTPNYNASYWFKNNKLVKFSYGFAYP